METSGAARRVAIYVRISKDRAGEGLGVERQERACREFCERMGWDVAQVFVENDTSAMGRRPEFDAMTAAARAGLLDGFVAWAWDRLCRRIVDLEGVLDLVEERGLVLGCVTGDLNVTTPSGRTLARVLTSIATGEVETLKMRIRAQQRQAADNGRPHGGRRAYGYTPDGLTLVESEAAVLQDAARRLLAGESVGSVVRDLNARAVPTVHGGAWRATSLRDALIKPRVAGLRSYRGEVHGAACWPAALDRATWTAVCSLFEDPARRMGAGHNTRRHLLSGIARCGREGCEGTMTVATTRGIGAYTCRVCRKVSRNQELADRYVTGAVLGLLADLTPVADGPDAELGAIGTELAALTENRRAIVRDFATLGMTQGDLKEALAASDARRAELEARRDALAAPLVLDAEVAGISRPDWDALPLARKRAVIGRLVEITFLPAGRGRSFDPARVQIRRRPRVTR